MDRIKLETKRVSIEFSGVRALDDTDFEVTTGKIRAVVGANGAGESTLMKVLARASSNYTEEVFLDDKKVEIKTPVDAKRLEMQAAYQGVDIALYPTLSVVENVVQNDMVMRKSGYIVNRNRTYKQRRAALDRLHISRDQADEHEPVQNLSLAQKQMVLIAKVIRLECNFLILDEPTALLNNTETEEPFRIVQHLYKTESTVILPISHRLSGILETCKNCMVMRDGKVIDIAPVTGQTIIKEIVEKMLGHAFEENFPREACEIGEMLSETLHLPGIRSKVKDVSIRVKSGEVVGIAGLVGADKPELCKILFGAFKMTDDKIMPKGRELKIANPSGAVKNRMVPVPEERRKEGVLVHENVSSNLSAVCLSRFCTDPFIRRRRVDTNAKRHVEDLGTSTPSVRQQVKNLSGGNQQKVAVGKWLAADCDIHIFDEPIKGVDVGAKQDMFHLINQTAKQGHGVIYTFCENSELLSLTDRMYVIYNGTVIAEPETVKTTKDEITYYSVGRTGNRNRTQ